MGEDSLGRTKKIESLRLMSSEGNDESCCLNASRLIMRQTPVMEEGAYQAQKGYRYDEAGHQESE